jgi:hypothetical protein
MSRSLGAEKKSKSYLENTIRNSIPAPSISATGSFGKPLQRPETKWGIP